MAKRKNPDLTRQLIQYIEKNLKFILLGIILLILLREFIRPIILFLFLLFIGVKTVQISRFMPTFNPEQITGGAILFGYLYGWKVGLAFGLLVGAIAFIKVSLLNLKTITVTLFMGLFGVISALFHNLGMSFSTAYMLTFAARMAITFPIFQLLENNPVENGIHSFGESLLNMFVTIHLYVLLYNLMIL